MNTELPTEKGQSIIIAEVRYTLVEPGVEPDAEGRGRIAIFEDDEGKKYMPSLAMPHFMIPMPD